MNEEDYKKLYYKTKKFYFEIGSVSCRAFQSELIPFGREGWRHILWKSKEVRPMEDRIRRFLLLKYAREAVMLGHIIHYREDVKNKILGKFWRLHLKIGRKSIKVVIRQIGLGKKHFFSIMD